MQQWGTALLQRWGGQEACASVSSTAGCGLLLHGLLRQWGHAQSSWLEFMLLASAEFGQQNCVARPVSSDIGWPQGRNGMDCLPQLGITPL